MTAFRFAVSASMACQGQLSPRVDVQGQDGVEEGKWQGRTYILCPWVLHVGAIVSHTVELVARMATMVTLEDREAVNSVSSFASVGMRLTLIAAPSPDRSVRSEATGSDFRGFNILIT